jgi:chromosome segregation ATPase
MAPATAAVTHRAVEPAHAAALVPMCDQKDCNSPATLSYVWAWGENGMCCSMHQGTLQQTATNLERTIQFAPLVAAAAAPLQRDERTRLIANALSLEAELEETKARGVELYNQSTQLTQQVQTLTVRNREADAQLRDQKIGFADMQAELDRKTADLGNAVDELGRLRVLVPREGVYRDAALEAALDDLNHVRDELEASKRENATMKQEITRLQGEAGKSRDELDRMKLDVQRLGAELEERNTIGASSSSTSSTPKKGK